MSHVANKKLVELGLETGLTLTSFRNQAEA